MIMPNNFDHWHHKKSNPVALGSESEPYHNEAWLNLPLMWLSCLYCYISSLVHTTWPFYHTHTSQVHQATFTKSYQNKPLYVRSANCMCAAPHYVIQPICRSVTFADWNFCFIFDVLVFTVFTFSFSVCVCFWLFFCLFVFLVYVVVLL